jgi:streptogramin lyase
MRSVILILVATGAFASLAAGAADSPRVVARIKVAAGVQPCAAAAGGGSVWVSEYGSPWLLRIDPKTNKVVGKTGIGFGSCGLGYGAGSLWIEDTSSNTVSRVSARTAKRTAAIKVGVQPYDATFAYGAAWVTSYGGGEVDRIDPARNRVVKTFKLSSATGVVAAFGSIWATGMPGVIRIDAATNKVVARIGIDGGAGWTAASGDAVWVTAGSGVARIDPTTNAVRATVPLGTPFLGDPAVVDGKLWVPKIRDNAVAIVDPTANAVESTFKAGVGPFVVTEVAGEAWIPSWQGREIWRVRP